MYLVQVWPRRLLCLVQALCPVTCCCRTQRWSTAGPWFVPGRWASRMSRTTSLSSSSWLWRSAPPQCWLAEHGRWMFPVPVARGHLFHSMNCSLFPSLFHTYTQIIFFFVFFLHPVFFMSSTFIWGYLPAKDKSTHIISILKMLWLCPHGLTFSWLGCYGLCNRHRPAELAHSFYYVLVSVSVFMALSTIFHSINSPSNSPLSHSVLLVLFLPCWSFQLYTTLCKSPSALIYSSVVDWA